MKVMRLRKPGGLENLYLDEADAREPGPGEIQVRVHATTLNYHDYAVVAGMIPAAEGRIPMSDGAGVVTKVGAEVKDFAPGDQVISTFFPRWTGGDIHPSKREIVPGDSADGFAAEYHTAPIDAFTRAPQGYTHAEAASLTCAGLTAWRALVEEGKMRAGQTVLVQGTGGVSIFALQFAKMFGCRVIATSSSNDKLDRLRQMGADHLINYRETPEWGKKAFELTGAVDHVVEIGGAGTLEQSIAACRQGGHISLIGVLAGYKGEVPTALIMGKQIRLIGITVGSREHQQHMIDAIEVNGMKPVLDKSFALEELAEAFRYQESGKHFGKICVEF
ncbi:NAD(P)-dependent alcohol dehydrogenase [Proteobacteria bacterium 005FR1]|nr:NAD(P)-dependent alcohol dehydrogenase [Proteobacteria bacterium 005FR1]